MEKQEKLNPAQEFANMKLDSSANIADDLFSWLRQQIVSGVFPPGYTFPNETVFCSELSIGRTTLREAYKALESSGFITRTKRGTYVNSAQDTAEAMPFSMMLELSDFEELLEFRAIFESETAALAAKRATPENISNLKKYLNHMEAHRDDLRLLTRYDTDFHMEVANASHNQLIINTFSSTVNIFFKAVYQAFQIDTETNIDEALHFHRQILNAIISHNSAKAKRAMREHINSVYNRVS